MILIRADGNKKIGIGHIMRCLTVADSLRKAGEEVIFVNADNTLSDLIASRGYKSYVLDTDFSKMDDEIPRFETVILELKPSRIIVDSYYITKEYLQYIRSLATLVYIDDLAAFAYPVDILVNYNIYGALLDYKGIYEKEGVSLPKLLLGPTYVPLRNMYRDMPAREQSKTGENILISTGGADPLHLALGIVKRIKASDELRNLQFHILIGVVNPDKEEIIRECDGIENLTTHYNVSDMKSLICSCDAVVSAAGSTMYEICACGVPMITYVSADNQIDGDRAFQKYGLGVSCGDLRTLEDPIGAILDKLVGLIGDYSLRVEMGRKMQASVDGMGADRIAEEIIKRQ